MSPTEGGGLKPGLNRVKLTQRGRKGAWRAEYIVLRERRGRSLQSDVHNFFLGMLLKFAWLLGTRVGEKGGGGGMVALRSSPRGSQILKSSKKTGGPERQISLS